MSIMNLCSKRSGSVGTPVCTGINRKATKVDFVHCATRGLGGESQYVGSVGNLIRTLENLSGCLGHVNNGSVQLLLGCPH